MPLPDFAFFLDRPDTPVAPQHDLWHRPLPAGPPGAAERPDTCGPPVTYGEYFTQARVFLAEGNCRRLRRALAAQSESPAGKIEAVAINLVKHGAFYHPARIDVHRGRHVQRLVLNVAASARGQALIGAEVRNLRGLISRYGPDFLPQVYVRGRSGRLPMFLGQWLEGYHEFHWSRDPRDGQLKMALWDPDRPDRVLSVPQVADLFRQTALVMTFYLDLERLYHIGAWHHGAGDFVASILDDRRVAVKLITVRRYQPLVKSLPHGLLLPAIQLFLVKLSLQNRMDRRDGVHEPVLAPQTAIAATVEGFFQGLERKVNAGVLAAADLQGLRQAIGRSDRTGLEGLVDVLATGLEKPGPLRVWDDGARQDHSAALHRALASRPAP